MLSGELEDFTKIQANLHCTYFVIIIENKRNVPEQTRFTICC